MVFWVKDVNESGRIVRLQVKKHEQMNTLYTLTNYNTLLLPSALGRLKQSL